MFREGKEAGNYVKRILKQCPFIIIKTYKTDMYDRYVSDVFYIMGEDDPDTVAREGNLLNRELLEKGLARSIGRLKFLKKKEEKVQLRVDGLEL